MLLSEHEKLLVIRHQHLFPSACESLVFWGHLLSLADYLLSHWIFCFWFLLTRQNEWNKKEKVLHVSNKAPQSRSVRMFFFFKLCLYCDVSSVELQFSLLKHWWLSDNLLLCLSTGSRTDAVSHSDAGGEDALLNTPKKGVRIGVPSPVLFSLLRKKGW